MTREQRQISSLPAHHFAAAVVPASINVDQRTIDVVWSTGEKVKFASAASRGALRSSTTTTATRSRA
jgi:hypothetical protein